jgi:hypothetical protein
MKLRFAKDHGFSQAQKCVERGFVLLKGTASAVPRESYFECGFSRCGTLFLSTPEINKARATQAKPRGV